MNKKESQDENSIIDIHLQRQIYLENYANQNLDFLYVSGSRLYGTNVENSDYDYRGVFLHEKENLFSVKKEDTFTDVVFDGDEDKVVYELKYFLTLIREQNPSVIEAIWVQEDKILKDSDVFRALRENREDLTASIFFEKAIGYALSQFKLANKVDTRSAKKELKEPQRIDYLIPFTTNKAFKDGEFPIEGVVATRHKKYAHIYTLYWKKDIKGDIDLSKDWFSHNTLSYLNSEKDVGSAEPIMMVEFLNDNYRADLNNYKNYLDWKEKSKNSSQEVKSFNYKAMSHAMRSLYMAEDFLDTNQINLISKNLKLLQDIRKELIPADECISLFNELKNNLEQRYLTFPKKEINIDLLNEICSNGYTSKLTVSNTQVKRNKP